MENPYLQEARIKAALRALNVRPTRAMGQNFLIDAAALDTIVQAADVTAGDLVIEVGPGLGVLTWELVQRAGHVISVELDKRLHERLAQEFAGAANLTLVQSDILRLRLADILTRNPSTATAPYASGHAAYKLVANLPYAITSPVLRHFLETDHRPERLVVLVQWEVAERIAAQPGNMSILAHSVQAYARPTIVARVPASSFFPAPAVDSAILRLDTHGTWGSSGDIEAVMRVIKAGFLHARKTLANALPSGLAAMGRKLERGDVLAALEQAGVEPQRRAETLSFAEWVRVYEALGRQ